MSFRHRLKLAARSPGLDVGRYNAAESAESAEARLFAPPRTHRIDTDAHQRLVAPLYEGQVRYLEMIEWVRARGFELWNLIPGFIDPVSARMLQFDGLFFRPQR